jgi:hypothetical protein
VFDVRSPIRARVVTLALATATPLPLLFWWRHVGFSFGLAAERGGFPMSGLWAFLPQADLQRSVLVAILVASLASALSAVTDPARRVTSVIFFGTAALVSTATAGEYWGTFANVARLFTPMAAAPLFAEGGTPSGYLRKGLALGVAISLLSLTALIVVREATRRSLPFFVMGETGALF